MLYDVYHDESKEKGYWHGILLVPQLSRQILLGHLKHIREVTKYNRPVTLKKLDKKSSRYECIRMWIELGAHALMQKTKGKTARIHNIKKCFSQHEQREAREFSEVIQIREPIRTKFILYKERDSHALMDDSWYPNHTAKIETTFRMGLKYGLHLLFDEGSHAHINSFHFDGHKHHGRPIDKKRVIGRLQGELKSYCSIPAATPIDERTGNHAIPDSQEYDDCQLLQLTDLMVGSFRTILGDAKNNVQKEASLPVKDLIEKWNRGYAGMKQSRWDKGFCLSECYLENEKWQFQGFDRRNKVNEAQTKLSLGM